MIRQRAALLWRPGFLRRSAVPSVRAFCDCRARLQGKDSNDSTYVKPWYVAEAEKQTAQYKKEDASKLPELPVDSPDQLEKIVSYVALDMGLKDVQVIDRRAEEYHLSGAQGPSMMVIGTGNGPRHLQSAGLQLLSWLKKDFGIHAGKEGILTTNFVRLHNKRQRRKQQRQRFSSSDNIETLQRVGSWIVVDTKIDSVYVHIMTEQRRAELDLEHLDLSAYDESITGDGPEADMADDRFVKPHTSRSTSSNPFHGRREFHTEINAIPESREELALQNLILEPNVDLSEDSNEVQDLVAHFPALPTLLDWKHRLQFFAVAALQSPKFSLRRLIEEAELQQASGFTLDDEDVELVMTGVCYHAQSHFMDLVRDDSTFASWEQLCNYKANLLFRLYSRVLRPAGRTLVYNPRLLVLLFRTFACPSRDSISPEQALASPREIPSARLDLFFDRRRLVPLRLLVEETPEALSLQTVGMVLTTLINGESYDSFWKVVAQVSLALSSDKARLGSLVELAIALIVKSKDHGQIVYAVQTFLPSVTQQSDVSLTPTIIAAVEAGLGLVSQESEVQFSSVRSLLDEHKKAALRLE